MLGTSLRGKSFYVDVNVIHEVCKNLLRERASHAENFLESGSGEIKLATTRFN